MEKSFSLLLRLVTWWSAAVWLVCAAAPALPVSVIAAAPAEVEFSYEADPEDGRVFFSFPTVPGYHYMMEESQDMTSWTPTPGGSWYGDGGSKRMFIIQGSVPSPQLTGVPPPGPPAGYMWSLRGVTFRVSLAPGNGAQVHVRREPDASFPEWDAVVDLRLPRPTGGARFLPLLTWEDESVMFWAGAAVTSPAALPADAVPHAGAHEEYEKAVFLALKDEMIARLTAPVAPPTLSAVSGPHRFLRFLRLRRTEADSTGRGIPVWWMLQYGLDPFDSSLTGSSTPFANGRTLAAAAAAGTTPAEPDHPAVAQITQWLSADFDRYNDSAGERAYGYSEEEEYWEDYEDGGPFSMTNPDEDWEGVMGRAGFGFSDIGSHTPSRSALFPFPVVSQTYADYIDLPASGSSSRQVVYIAGGTSARVKLATDGPRPFPVTRKFLRVLRDADTRGAAAQEWHYTGVPTGAEIVVPAEGSAGVLPELFVPNDRPALGGLEPNTEGIAQAWLQNVDFAADVNGNGGVDNQDGADGQSARYVVNYDFDGNRSIAEAPGVPIEDAIKWTALNASITAQGEPLRRLTPKYEEWSIAPGEDRRELTRLLLPVTPVLGPEVEVWLTMPKEETAEGRKHSAASRYETQAFHLYMGNPWLTGPSGKTVPLWGGVGVPGAVGTTVTVEEENVGGSGTVEYEVELAPEVEISKYVNPQAPGYLGDDPVAGSHTLVLEGILFKGMPLPGEDRLGTYRGDGETTGDDLFDGEIEIVVEYRRGDAVLQSDSVKLRCFSEVPLESNNQPKKLLAFDGAKDETKAQGYGKYAKGGRYGHVYTVTNKSDDANDPGSLRYAIQSPVPRTIVFALPAGKDSGTIKLATDLIITDRDCTIAGQTAFRKDSLGVCLKGFGLTVDTDDVIVRYLRSRPGALLNPGDAPVAGPRTNIDSFAIAGVSTRVIFDHCSASFSNDCLFDTVTTKVSNSEYRSRPDRAITVRNCLLAWPLDYNNHYEPENGVMTRQEHGYGGQIRAGNGAKITYCWNLYAHCRGRGPAVIGVASIATDGKGPRLDFLNNVIYGWGDKGSTSVTKASGYDGGDKYFPAGIASNSNFERNYYRARLASGAGNKHWFRTKNPNAKAWFKANAISIPPQTTWTEPGNPYTTDYVSYQTPASPPAGGGAGSLFVAAAFPTPDEFFPPLLAPALSGKRVRAGVGASITRDALDQLLLGKDGEGGQYHDGTGTIIDNENQVGGWPELSANTPPLDTDGDGIPDDREPVTPGRAVPWPHDPRNASMDDDRDGYTNLEEYLVSP